jgi:DNA-binding transcriptional regulator YiaG
MKIGDEIKAIRVRMGLTQKEFAKPLEVSHVAVSNWELYKAQQLPPQPNKFNNDIMWVDRNDKE